MWKVSLPQIKTLSRLTPYIPALIGRGFTAKLLNIRRYVDNSPPAEPHDVRAHIKGGVPVSEIDSLGAYYELYPGIKESLFAPRANDSKYMDFSDAILEKEKIKPLVESAEAVQTKNKQFLFAVEKWWKANLADIESLPENKDNQF